MFPESATSPLVRVVVFHCCSYNGPLVGSLEGALVGSLEGALVGSHK